jgi:hypothetical protein
MSDIKNFILSCCESDTGETARELVKQKLQSIGIYDKIIKIIGEIGKDTTYELNEQKITNEFIEEASLCIRTWGLSELKKDYLYKDIRENMEYRCQESFVQGILSEVIGVWVAGYLTNRNISFEELKPLAVDAAWTDFAGSYISRQVDKISSLCKEIS